MAGKMVFYIQNADGTTEERVVEEPYSPPPKPKRDPSRIVIPRETRLPGARSHWDNTILKGWGFTFSGETDRFEQVAFLPEGWTREYRSSKDRLIDPNGNERATISSFLGAWRSDPDAWIDVHRRFWCKWNPVKDWEGERAKKPRNYLVMDNKTGEVVWEGPMITVEEDPMFHGPNPDVKGETWLDENFPEWRDVNAYWD